MTISLIDVELTTSNNWDAHSLHQVVVGGSKMTISLIDVKSMTLNDRIPQGKILSGLSEP